VRKVLRIAGIVVGSFLLLILVFRLGLGLYLDSDHARRLASEQLSTLLGGNVRVTELDAGIGSTEIRVEVLSQPGPDGMAPVEPIVTGKLRADVSPVGLAAGSTPTAISLDNAHVRLRFDKDGNLLDRLPEPQATGEAARLPAINVKGASLHFSQEGRPDFRVSGIDVAVTDDGKLLHLTGRADDPTWKGWALSGEWDKAAATGSATLRTEDRVAVTPDMLRSVPFVPPETWEWVVLDGDTSCSLQVSRGADEQIGYRIELDPRNTRLTVPPIDLTTTDTSGLVVVENEVVTLSHVRGRTAGGELEIGSTLNFATEPSRLNFKVVARGLDIQRLPETWGLPKLDAGLLEGGATIELVIRDGRVEPWGRGEADIIGGRLFGGDVEGKITLVGDGQRLRFQSQVAAAPRRDPGGGIDTVVALLTLLLQPPDKPSTPGDAEPTYVQANLRLTDIDLEELIQRLEVDLPIRVTGRASLEVLVEIPVAEFRTLRAYRVHGKLTVPRLGLEDLTLDRVAADIIFREGVLSLTNLSGEVPRPDDPDARPGTFVGTARYGVDPQTDLTADLKLTSIPVAEVFRAVPDLAGLASGLVSGSAKLSAPGDRLDDITAYVADGVLTSPALTAFDRRVEKVSLKLALREGVAQITDASAVIEGLPVSGHGSVTLEGKYPYAASVKTASADAVALRRLVPEFDLPFDVTGRFQTTAELKGTLNPVTFVTTGTATATGLVIGTAKVEKVAFTWAADEDAVMVRDIRSDLYQGMIAGSARFPLNRTEAGGFDLTFRDIDAAALTRAVPDIPVRLEGEVSGTLKGKLPPADVADARRAEATLDLTAPRLRVQGIPTERLRGRIDYEPGALGYELTGEALGGSFDLSGTYPLAPQKKEKQKKDGPPRASGRIRVSGVQLGRLSEGLGMPVLAPLRGAINLSASYEYSWLVGGVMGSGRLEIIDFGWGRAGIGEDLRADISVTPTAVEVPNLSGRFADGTLRGRIRYNFTAPERSFYTLSLDGADAGRLLAPFGFADLAARVNVTTRGELGPRLRGSGTVSLHRGKLTGFQLAEVRVPFDWNYTPGSGGRLGIRDAGGQLLGGRVSGEATVAWGLTTHIQGRIRFTNLSFRAVLGQFGQSSGLGSSRMNGQFTFTGTGMRSINDLSGQLNATLGEGPVFDLPVFSQLAQYLVPGAGVRSLVQFTEGELRGRLGGGQFRLERLAMAGPNSRLFMEGTIGLNGALDLDVLAAIGRVGPDPRILRLFGLRLPTVGPIPLGLLLEVSDYLSNRTIRARVSGTINRPIVQVDVARLLSESAVRYFLQPYIPFSR
jgi:translocation and assembly module TamB